MRKKVVGLLSIALVVAILAVVWWRGRSSPVTPVVPPKPSEVSVAPAPARAADAPGSMTGPLPQPAPTGAATPQAMPVAAQPHSVTSSSATPTSVSAATSPTPVETTPNNEELATRRMYAAHAPLRTPEVADPDSKSNKQILQTMIQKALVHAKAADPAKP